MGKGLSGGFLEVFCGQGSCSLSSATFSEMLMSVSLGNIHVCIPSFIVHSEEVSLTTVCFSELSSLFSTFLGRVRFFCKLPFTPLAYLRLTQFSLRTLEQMSSLAAARELAGVPVCFSSVVMLALLAVDALGFCLL